MNDEYKLKICSNHSVHPKCLDKKEKDINIDFCSSCDFRIKNKIDLLKNDKLNLEKMKYQENIDLKNPGLNVNLSKQFSYGGILLSLKKNSSFVFTQIDLSKAKKCSSQSCKNVSFLAFECGHSICITCIDIRFSFNIGNNVALYDYCIICNNAKIIKSIRLTCRCTISNSFLSKQFAYFLPISMRISKSHEYFYICFGCNSKIQNSEITHFFNKYFKNKEKITKTKLFVEEIMKYSNPKGICKFCKIVDNICFRIYECDCLDNFICYSCLLYIEFNLNFISRLCPSCNKNSFSSEIIQTFFNLNERSLIKANQIIFQNIKNSLSLLN